MLRSSSTLGRSLAPFRRSRAPEGTHLRRSLPTSDEEEASAVLPRVDLLCMAQYNAAMYHQRPVVQVVSQVSIDLPSGDSDRTFESCRRKALEWVESHAGAGLPLKAWSGGAFELRRLDIQPVSAASSDGYWVVRIDDADKNVAQRTWITEIGIGRGEGDTVTFGCRLHCRALRDNPRFSPTIPNVVRDVAHALPTEVDGRPLSTSAWRVQDATTLEQLVNFLQNPKRQRSVIVVTSPPAFDMPAVDPDDLANSLIGVAHVVFLTDEASFLLTEELGREFSVFGGAVRTYRTGFFPDVDQPSSHPLALYDKIKNSYGVQAFRDFVVKRTMDTYLSSRHLSDELPSYASIRAIAAKREQEERRHEGASVSELLKLALDDNEKLRQELDNEKMVSSSLIDIAERECDLVQSKLDQSRQVNFRLRTRIESLKSDLSGLGYDRGEDIPNTLDDIESWCEANLGESIFMLNRAYRGLKKSKFEEISLIYKALILLRDHYVQARRMGNTEQMLAFKEACRSLGLEETESISRTRAGEEGENYFVDYHGNRVVLDRHLKKGNTRDPRYCFRLYFFWDEEEEQVVVGWLPSHLDNRAT